MQFKNAVRIKYFYHLLEEWDEYIQSLEETNRVEQSWMLGVNPKSREAMSVENLSPPLEPLV